MTDRFHQVSHSVLDALLDADPQWASDLGDVRQAGRLTDYAPDARADRAAVLTDGLGALDDIDDTQLAPADIVDLELLRGKLSADLWRLTELCPHAWNPLIQLPNAALYELVVKEDLPTCERVRALTARCARVPAFLETARATLNSSLPRPHVETAAARARGAAELLGGPLEALLAAEPGAESELRGVADEARTALREHADWLDSRLELADADPRLGARDYAAQLWYVQDAEISPDQLLTRAESDLLAVEEELAEVAARIEDRPTDPDQVRRVLERLAAERPTDAETLLPACERDLEYLLDRVADLDVVTLYDDEVRVIPMPEAQRGIAAAYCDAPGPLAPRDRAAVTFVAVAPPPPDWPAGRAESFYREYNGHMVRNLMVHEAVPGHAVQLAHARRYSAATNVRAALRSGPFIEGWAVYAEETIAGSGWGDDTGENLALRAVQLKMRLRTTLNAILDVRTHCGELDEAEAMALLTGRGHQEESEARAKWRRAQLTSAQLATYYVGHAEMRAIARDLRVERPTASDRDIHDAMLSMGSPPPRYLRALLGI
ncbi:DUF885 domain-containing protein [Spiractinospora alimapuensis]|nr:DUF885 domain-containing protein [Spiractinospora alimapuensis]